MSTTSVTKFPTAASGSGWTNPANVYADDGSYATATTTTSQAETLRCYAFAFDIAAGEAVASLTVEGQAKVASFTGMLTLTPWTAAGSARGVPASGALGTSDTTVSKAATTNLPTIDEVNDEGFSIYVAVSSNQYPGPTASVDYVKLTVVHYTPATVTTDAVSDITQTTATCGGETTDDGSGTIAACGVCWNTSGSPTLADAHTEDDSGITSFVSSLTGLWSSTTYYVRAYATTEDGTAYGNEVSFTTLGSGSRSLVARPFTTRAAAAELVARTGDGIIDWWFEDDVLHAEVRPTDVASIPRGRWHIVSRDMPGVSVSLKMNSEDTPDIVCVVFKAFGVSDIRDGTILRAYVPAAPTSAIQRVQLVDLSGQYMAVADAESYGANVLLRISADVMTATVTAKGGLFTVDGQFRAAPLIKAGDWIDVVDLPGHVPTFITGSTYSMAERMVTLTTGGTEQRELVVPGMSALPSALRVYAGYGQKPGVVPREWEETEWEDPGERNLKPGVVPYRPGVPWVDPVPYEPGIDPWP